MKKEVLSLLLSLVLVLLFKCTLFAQESKVGEKINLNPELKLIQYENDHTNFCVLDELLDSKAGLSLIIFWNSSCGPCIAELDLIEGMLSSDSISPSLPVIAISLDKPLNHIRAKNIATAKDWSFDCYFDNRNKVRNAILGNWFGTPQSLVIDSKGEIRYHSFGFRKNEVKAIISHINTFCDGKNIDNNYLN